MSKLVDKFCDKCDNMCYPSISMVDANKLVYYCRACNTVKDMNDQDIVCVLSTNFSTQGASFEHLVNEYTKYDPTLPHVHNLKCPNKRCICNDESSKVKSDIMYMRYDEDNMKYLYICYHCDYKWTTGELSA